MKYIVDRKTWLRGEGPGKSRLLTEQGLMCCLGHCLLQSGVSRDELLDNSSPRQLQKLIIPFTESNQGFIDNSSLSLYAMPINDNIGSDYNRELQLKSLFSKSGHEIIFEN